MRVHRMPVKWRRTTDRNCLTPPGEQELERGFRDLSDDCVWRGGGRASVEVPSVTRLLRGAWTLIQDGRRVRTATRRCLGPRGRRGGRGARRCRGKAGPLWQKRARRRRGFGQQRANPRAVVGRPRFRKTRVRGHSGRRATGLRACQAPSGRQTERCRSLTRASAKSALTLAWLGTQCRRRKSQVSGCSWVRIWGTSTACNCICAGTRARVFLVR